MVSDWRLPPLWLYYQASRPWRWWNNHRLARDGRAPVIVLFYHRVADTELNPWTCPTAVFARQVDWLARHFDLVSLSEAQTRLREGNDRPAACITFDDGYADNADYALPLLVRRGVPCTYFVSLKFVAEGRPFPHDVDRGRPLPPNTINQLRHWARRGIEIGAHTRTHADLGRITDPQQLYDEVVAAGDELAHRVDRPIRYFAFPYGLPANLSRQAFQLARQAGYAGVCSAYGGYNFPGDDPFHLQRIHGDPDPVRLKNWATVDPRKQHIRLWADVPPEVETVSGASAT